MWARHGVRTTCGCVEFFNLAKKMYKKLKCSELMNHIFEEVKEKKPELLCSDQNEEKKTESAEEDGTDEEENEEDSTDEEENEEYSTDDRQRKMKAKSHQKAEATSHH
ncbi:hypothetical protein V2J09_001626 [Rumex salicifolius]